MVTFSSLSCLKGRDLRCGALLLSLLLSATGVVEGVDSSQKGDCLSIYNSSTKSLFLQTSFPL